MEPTITRFRRNQFKDLVLPKIGAHKGDNGKVLVIGGSTLFHSASIWAAELVSRFVDLVFYYSPALINRELLMEAKKNFRNGIVVRAAELENYLREADVVIIGPGMKRRENTGKPEAGLLSAEPDKVERLEDEGMITHLLTNSLLAKYPAKKWVVDAGSLQELEKKNMTDSMVLTPHLGEFLRLFPAYGPFLTKKEPGEGFFRSFREKGTWLLKRQGVDYAFRSGGRTVYKIIGGNAGLTKGGTGDLLAALVAALCAKNPPLLSAAAASLVLKKTAETIYAKRGPFYTTTELMERIPEVFWQMRETKLETEG